MATIISQQVTAAAAAAAVTLNQNTTIVQVMNLSANSAYVNPNGTATAGSGSLYIKGSDGWDRWVLVGAGQSLSYIRGGASDATLEITEVG